MATHAAMAIAAIDTQLQGRHFREAKRLLIN
jgi:hypothetical protein